MLPERLRFRQTAVTDGKISQSIFRCSSYLNKDTQGNKYPAFGNTTGNCQVSEEEYVDTNFEWSFLELTERMEHLLQEDRHIYSRVHLHKKSMFFPRMPDSSLSRRLSRESDQLTSNVLDVLPKTAVTVGHQHHFKEELDRWSFDIFALSYDTNGHPMQTLAFEIFTVHGLFNAFQLPEEVFMRFIVQVEKHYRLNPYHNACHAADVLQTVHCIISKTGFITIMNKLEVFCLMLTAIVHDVEHTGTNNSFHKNSGDSTGLSFYDEGHRGNIKHSDMAKLYVVSVLENHHIRVGLKLMQENDILKSLDNESYEEFQYMLVTMILATDMANHFLLITNMKLMLSMPTKCKKRMRMKRILLILLHCADISNPAKPWDLHKSWVSLLVEEFFLQGDKERDLKLPITPNCDRNTANIATLQIGFMQTFSRDTFVVTDQLIEMELMNAGHTYIHYMPWHDCMDENMAKWNGKWKFLKYEQINELLAESAKPRLSMAPPPRRSYEVVEQTICFCCTCGRKNSLENDSSHAIAMNSNY